MATKTHIVDRAVPYLHNGEALTTRCRLTIERPSFVCMWDMQEMGEPLNLPLGICRKCLKVEDPKLRYTYGVKV